uniref:Uncharacterized protein n=1 Tax=Anguilla anguilla TaxID=7936 RepID=A0A0E9XXK5_ANGAN
MWPGLPITSIKANVIGDNLKFR